MNPNQLEENAANATITLSIVDMSFSYLFQDLPDFDKRRDAFLKDLGPVLLSMENARRDFDIPAGMQVLKFLQDRLNPPTRLEGNNPPSEEGDS